MYVYLPEKSHRNRELQNQIKLFVLRNYFSFDHLYYSFYHCSLRLSSGFLFETFFFLAKLFVGTVGGILSFSGNQLKTQVENCSSIKHNSGWKRKGLGLSTVPGTVLSKVAANGHVWLFQLQLVKIEWTSSVTPVRCSSATGGCLITELGCRVFLSLRTALSCSTYCSGEANAGVQRHDPPIPALQFPDHLPHLRQNVLCFWAFYSLPTKRERKTAFSPNGLDLGLKGNGWNWFSATDMNQTL